MSTSQIHLQEILPHIHKYYSEYTQLVLIRFPRRSEDRITEQGEKKTKQVDVPDPEAHLNDQTLKSSWEWWTQTSPVTS